MKISVVIPSRNENDTLERTLRNLQENIVGDTDVHVILDRWKPEPEIKMNDTRFHFHYFEQGIGQRGGMNWVVENYISDVYFKLDAHCAVSPGFDDGLRETFQDLEGSPTVVPIMYNLNVENWEPKRHKRTMQMYMAMEKGSLRALYYGRQPKPPVEEGDYIETMACMGPGWAVKRDWFIKTGMCETGGTGQAGWGAQSVEVSCKAWLSGERLVTTKKCWFAHWFRGHVGFPYNISGREVENARKFHTNLWINDKWEHKHPDRSWKWLLNKFNPPGWKEDNTPMKVTDISEERMELFKPMYQQIQRKKNLPQWRGVPIMKFPNDLILYQEVIHKKKPDFIVEIGTNKGGSALYFQDLLDMYNPGGQVITIDVKKVAKEWDPRITYLLGDGKSDEIIEQVKQMVGDKSVMVILDGDHRRQQVKWELYKYRHIVTPGQYMVAEDCYIDRGAYGPKEAVDWFLDRHKGWQYVDESAKYIHGITMGGWLLKS